MKMGFLDKLFNRKNENTGNSMDDFRRSNDYNGTRNYTVNKPAKRKPKVEHHEPFAKELNAIGSNIKDRGSEEYFEDLILKNIPGTQVKTYVPLKELGIASPGFSDSVNVLVYRNGVPSIAIVIVEKVCYDEASVLDVMDACEDAGLPCIRFIYDFANNPDYVIGRIKAIMK